MFHDLIPCVKSINEQFRKGISDEDFEVFMNVLDKISGNAE